MKKIVISLVALFFVAGVALAAMFAKWDSDIGGAKLK